MKSQGLKPVQFIIFGGTGDLTKRKLLPAFYNLLAHNLWPEDYKIIAIGRRNKDSELYRQEARQAIKDFSRLSLKEELWQDLSSHIFYQPFDFRYDQGYQKLKEILGDFRGLRVFYLAVSPEYFALIVDKLKKHKLLEGPAVNRLVIEKPFGRDLLSAQRLNAKIQEVFPEKDIFRIDHYLGKEMLQNMMVIRFANAFFEPLWNNKYIDNIQIISSESDGVGIRGGYYEKAGALRDMVQNHMLQLLALTAMEPPVDLEMESIRNEKVKVLKALANFEFDNSADFFVRGQYGAGRVQGREVPAYRDEERTSPESNTETFVALKIMINNLRWSGVPFYIKTGKRLSHKSTEVVIEFNSLPHPAYLKAFPELQANLLVIRVQPLEGIYLQFNAKEPGTKQKILPVKMDFCQNCQVNSNSPEAYERLIYDVLRGDSTLFTRWDEVEYSWRFVDKIAEAWQREEVNFPNYAAGSNGPREADELLARDGRRWWQV